MAATAAPPTARPTPAPPQVVRFRREGFSPPEERLVVDCTRPDFDGTVRLAWDIANADGVTLAIDGTGIYASYPGTSGHDDVPFACGPPSDTDTPSHTYVLTTTGGVGQPDSRQRIITAGLPRIDHFSVTVSGTCTDPVDLLDVFISWQIAFATGVSLTIDDGLYGTFSGKQGQMVPAGQFECGSAPHNYRLTTTGGYGPPASEAETILQP